MRFRVAIQTLSTISIDFRTIGNRFEIGFLEAGISIDQVQERHTGT